MSHFRLTCFAKKSSRKLRNNWWSAVTYANVMRILLWFTTVWYKVIWLFKKKFKERSCRDSKEKRNDLQRVLGVGCIFVPLVSVLHCTSFLHSSVVATCSLGYCIVHIHPTSFCFNNFTRCGWAKNILVAKGHLSLSQEAKTYWLVHYITFSSLSLSFLMFHCLVTLCLSVYPSLLLPRTFFTHSRKNMS